MLRVLRVLRLTVGSGARGWLGYSRLARVHAVGWGARGWLGVSRVDEGARLGGGLGRAKSDEERAFGWGDGGRRVGGVRGDEGLIRVDEGRSGWTGARGSMRVDEGGWGGVAGSRLGGARLTRALGLSRVCWARRLGVELASAVAKPGGRAEGA